MDQTDPDEIPDYVAAMRLDRFGAVVFGAGQGIGRQTSHALSQAGARVLCVDVNARVAEAVAGELGGTAFVGSVLDRGDIQRALDAAKNEFGRVDTVIDIVGQARFKPFLESTEADWDWTFNMVLRHALHVAQLAAPLLSESGHGSLSFVSSNSALTSSPLHATYGAAKAGLMSLVRTLCVEYGDLNIRVNAVAPGPTWTPRMAAALGEGAREHIGAIAARHRVGMPSDIAGALLYLSSPLADHVNGQTLLVDGGGHLAYPYPMDFVPRP